MANSFIITDETAVAQRLGADSSNRVEIGNGTPSAPLTVNGIVARKSSVSALGDALAPSSASIKTASSVSVTGSGGTSTVSTSLGRAPFAVIGEVAITNGALIKSSNSSGFTIQNFGATQSVSYSYI